MTLLIGVFYFILGMLVGSFLNVVALRYNTGRGISGRSSCFSCGKKLAWHELIPIFSFVLQLGKCRECGSKLSWQYTLVELLTGIIFLGVFLRFPYMILPTIYFMLTFSILIVILIYDFRHKIIPDGLVYTFIILSFASLFVDFGMLKVITPTLFNLFAGPLLFLPFFLLWLISAGRWMGLGDAKLAAGIGWFLGLSNGLSAIILAFWLGALVGISALFLRDKTFTMRSEVPFGPFLISGLFIVFFFNINILQLIL